MNKVKHREHIKDMFIGDKEYLNIDELINLLCSAKESGATHIYHINYESMGTFTLEAEKLVFETDEEAESREKEERLKREEQENSRDLREYLRLKEKFGIND